MGATTKKALTAKVAATKKAPAAKLTTPTKPKGAAKASPPKAPATKTTAPSQPIPPPPPWVFPAVPNGFQPPDATTVRRRSKPTEQMRAEGEDFASELRTETSYADDFGKRAPDPIELADMVDVATQWDAIYDSVAPVAEYALAMRGAAWDAALKPVKKLQTAYEGAVADEPSLATTWRQTAAFFGAREESAQRAVQTKAKAKKAAKKAAKAAAAATKS